MTPQAECSPSIRVDVERHHDVSFLMVTGVLDGTTYRGLRDAVIKAALDEPRAVIVDVNKLSVSSESAWSVFTSARWHVSVWPDVPILLVCEHQRSLQTITATGVSRYVPVYPTRDSALNAATDRSSHGRRRAKTQLPCTRVSVGLARAMVTDWLTQWDKRELIPAAATVATIFVENVLDHTESAPVLIVPRSVLVRPSPILTPPGPDDWDLERPVGKQQVSLQARSSQSSPTTGSHRQQQN